MVLILHFFEPLLPCFLLTLSPDSSVSCDLVSFFFYPLIPIDSRHLIPVIFFDFGRFLLNQLVLLLDGLNGIICISVLSASLSCVETRREPALEVNQKQSYSRLPENFSYLLSSRAFDFSNKYQHLRQPVLRP